MKSVCGFDNFEARSGVLKFLHKKIRKPNNNQRHGKSQKIQSSKGQRHFGRHGDVKYHLKHQTCLGRMRGHPFKVNSTSFFVDNHSHPCFHFSPRNGVLERAATSCLGPVLPSKDPVSRIFFNGCFVEHNASQKRGRDGGATGTNTIYPMRVKNNQPENLTLLIFRPPKLCCGVAAGLVSGKLFNQHCFVVVAAMFSGPWVPNRPLHMGVFWACGCLGCRFSK